MQTVGEYPSQDALGHITRRGQTAFEHPSPRADALGTHFWARLDDGEDTQEEVLGERR